jgi:hypothetical protein
MVDVVGLSQALQNKYAFKGTPADFGGDINAYMAASKAHDEANAAAYTQELGQQIGAAQDAANPYVQISPSAYGLPGLSLRQSDYNDQLAKFQAEYPTAATSGNEFNSNFASFLRRTNAPKMGDERGTYLGQTTPGLSFSNEQAVEQINRFNDQRRSAERKGRLGNALKIGAGALAAFAAPAVLGGLGVGGATGVSAGSALPAASSGGGGLFGGLGSAFGKFSTGQALSGAVKGGLGGLMSGDGLSGALKGAALGGVTGGYGGALASGLGIQGTANTAAFTGALTGASGGLAAGDAKTAGLGAVLGGAGGYLSSGGQVPGLGSAAEKLPSDVAGPVRQGTGLIGKVQDAGRAVSSGLSGLTGGSTEGSGGMLSNALKIGGSIFEDSATRKNNEKIMQELARSKGEAQGYLNPYLQSGNAANTKLSQALQAGFQPGDLTQDPGYQFRLQEGERALQRRMAASGLGQSGAALKAAQEYGQGLADQTYNDAYQRYLANNQQLQTAANAGQDASNQSAQLAASAFDPRSVLMTNNQESKNKRLASILGGIGAFF